MNPEGFPAEAVPLQGTTYYGLPGQPEASTVIQSTTVNLRPEPPKDHIIWSLCCLVYGNPCCLGLAALIFSIKSRDRKVVGDLEGARHYGSTARCLNIWATVLVSSLILVNIIVFIVVLVNVTSYSHSYRG